MDATEQAQRIASRDLSPSEAVEAAIAQIEATNGATQAVIHTLFDEARTAVKSGLPSGPFEGVPTLIKDLTELKGVPITAGTRLLTRLKSPYDNGSVERIKEAGMVILGKTNTPELGLLPVTEGSRHGPAFNPWNTDYNAGGSSGGAAGAVASGMVPLAQATDGGGSIRIPASMCGLFGLKPSRGRLYKGRCQPVTGDLVVSFCVSKSVRDSARLLEWMERKDTDAPFPSVGHVTGPNKRRLRVGVLYDALYQGKNAHPQVQREIEKTAKLCADLGHEVVEAAPPPIDPQEFADQFFVVWKSIPDRMVKLARLLGLIQFRWCSSETHLERWTNELVSRHRAARKKNPALLDEAVEYFGRARVQFLEVFKNHDVLLTPVLRTPQPVVGTMSPDIAYETLFERILDYATYTPIHNATGLPAMSVPLGRDDHGMPVGSMFCAPHGNEGTLLELAYELEAAAPWKMPYDI